MSGKVTLDGRLSKIVISGIIRVNDSVCENAKVRRISQKRWGADTPSGGHGGAMVGSLPIRDWNSVDSPYRQGHLRLEDCSETRRFLDIAEFLVSATPPRETRHLFR